jgi:hypothetical protein
MLPQANPGAGKGLMGETFFTKRSAALVEFARPTHIISPHERRRLFVTLPHPERCHETQLVLCRRLQGYEDGDGLLAQYNLPAWRVEHIHRRCQRTKAAEISTSTSIRFAAKCHD